MQAEIKIVYDDEAQSVNVRFDPNQIRRWELAVAVLKMAVSDAEFTLNVKRAESLQRAAIEQAQAHAMGVQVLKGKIIQ